MLGLFLGLFYGLRLCETNKEKFTENATQQMTIQIYEGATGLVWIWSQKYIRKGTAIIMRCV